MSQQSSKAIQMLLQKEPKVGKIFELLRIQDLERITSGPTVDPNEIAYFAKNLKADLVGGLYPMSQQIEAVLAVTALFTGYSNLGTPPATTDSPEAGQGLSAPATKEQPPVQWWGCA